MFQAQILTHHKIQNILYNNTQNVEYILNAVDGCGW